jgi:hypothetical protein
MITHPRYQRKTAHPHETSHPPTPGPHLPQEQKAHQHALTQLTEARGQAALWKACADLAQLGSQTFPASPLSERTLKSLLAIAHPDKWSQGQPATELAHEIAVAINAARERLEVPL